MKAGRTPSQKVLQALFSYADGRLTWIKKSTRRPYRVGTIAGTLRPDGYREIKVYGFEHLAHRLIWSFHHGVITGEQVVDHISHNRSDNRIENLQLLTPRPVAKKSRRKRPEQLNMPVGVDFRCGRYAARLTLDGRLKQVGTFDTVDGAVAALEAFIK